MQGGYTYHYFLFTRLSSISGAAIYGLRGKKDCTVFILHPRNRISPVQEAQMTSVLDENGNA